MERHLEYKVARKFIEKIATKRFKKWMKKKFAVPKLKEHHGLKRMFFLDTNNAFQEKLREKESTVNQLTIQIQEVQPRENI